MFKIICPFHKNKGTKERTPSLAVYEDGFHCFSCGVSGNLDQIAKWTSRKARPKGKTDVQRAIERIRSYPVKTIRGFDLHYDRNGYYLLWPSNTYYIYRRFDNASPKYLGPSGVPRPPFWASEKGSPLIMVEGEFNALSIHKAVPQAAVVSCGGVEDLRKGLPEIRLYDKILIVVDSDKPGTEAGKSLKTRIKHTNARVLVMQQDANEIHTKDGIKAVKKAVERGLRVL